MHTAAEVHPLAWLYFVSFVIISAFVVINVFIAIIIESLSEDRKGRLEEPASKEDLLRELRSTREALRRVEERLEKESSDQIARGGY